MAAVLLQWEHDGIGVEHFVISRRPFNTGNFQTISGPAGSIGPTVREFMDTGLTANSRYDWRIVAVHTINGQSTFAEIVGHQVVVPPPNPPTNFTATTLPA